MENRRSFPFGTFQGFFGILVVVGLLVFFTALAADAPTGASEGDRALLDAIQGAKAFIALGFVALGMIGLTIIEGVKRLPPRA
ncbi:MAG TPA: hypothetical protein VMX97_06945 [Hyphomicrobiaceae bacterium]|nr:hypothetical protein [Hyphomicrobiaceae bacterium]